MNEKTVFESCPFCGCFQFYIQKDFNRFLGCLIVLVGIVLVPKTYGLSLPIVAFIDWIFYLNVPTMVLCYRCGAEFRGFKVPDQLKPFIHAIGDKYEREGNQNLDSFLDKKEPLV